MFSANRAAYAPFTCLRTLALLSHSQDVTGSVHAICKRILMLGYSCASHSLMASDGELGSLSAGTVLYLDFHLHISFSNSSEVGRSC